MTGSEGLGIKNLKQFQLSYNNTLGEEVKIPLQEGNIIFVLGANGTGKSALMHRVFIQNQSDAIRITAHRQTWFTSNILDFTPTGKAQTENQIRSTGTQAQSRWRDDIGVRRSQVTIFNLINSQNVRARRITDAVDNADIKLAQKLSEKEAPLKTLNHLLHLGNLPINIIIEDDEKLLASKDGCIPYSIAELSDGERNAVLIAADVLTSKENTLFIIDEPERHLHRSIISPLLSALFLSRTDCAFVIATHDIGLPMDNPESSVLLLRSCDWNGNDVSSWDADMISAKDEIDYHIKLDILGSRRHILFVEGTSDSLDCHIYQILFPNMSIIPQGSCYDVEKAVQGIRQTETLHWVSAFGLIDADNRQEEEIERLKLQNVFTLPCYSVESIYYKDSMIRHIATKQADVTGENANELFNKASQKFSEVILTHKARLCARICERKIRDKIKLPNWKDIQSKTPININYDVNAIVEEEERKFDSYIQTNDMNSLIGRYPVRETPVLGEIAKALGFQDRKKYESAVIKLLVDDENIRIQTKKSLNPLADAIEQA